jgi:thiamine-phosphate pyrophosphorylase
LDFNLPRIYPITDPRIAKISHAEQVQKLMAGGAEIIQLRDKYHAPKDFYEAAKAALAIAQRQGVKIIINDRADIALALKADGVHLGQDDLPPDRARKILGERAIIGFSTHNLNKPSPR